jgi:hypothetical protein
MNINLHIERLVLDGLPVGQNQASLIQWAIETELTRLLAENGLAADLETGGVVPGFRANGIQLASSNPVNMGTLIAQSVYGGIGNDQ